MLNKTQKQPIKEKRTEFRVSRLDSGNFNQIKRTNYLYLVIIKNVSLISFAFTLHTIYHFINICGNYKMSLIYHCDVFLYLYQCCNYKI